MEQDLVANHNACNESDPVDDNEMDVDDDEYRPTSKRKADEPAEPGQPGKRQRKQTEKCESIRLPLWPD